MSFSQKSCSIFHLLSSPMAWWWRLGRFHQYIYNIHSHWHCHTFGSLQLLFLVWPGCSTTYIALIEYGIHTFQIHRVLHRGSQAVPREQHFCLNPSILPFPHGEKLATCLKHLFDLPRWIMRKPLLCSYTCGNVSSKTSPSISLISERSVRTPLAAIYGVLAWSWPCLVLLYPEWSASSTTSKCNLIIWCIELIVLSIKGTEQRPRSILFTWYIQERNTSQLHTR